MRKDKDKNFNRSLVAVPGVSRYAGTKTRKSKPVPITKNVVSAPRANWASPHSD